MYPAKDIHRPEAAALSASLSRDADLAQPATKRDARFRIGGDEVDRGSRSWSDMIALARLWNSDSSTTDCNRVILGRHIGFSGVYVSDV
ncbi:hypothetical protein ATI53_10753 [Salipiger aestuarii]|uniref:Uncharacterized protein n=1 Tax=Salipiger aestuarii TaxID=568098 RepID=A0A327XKN1_9RHOB|nr:hypothetical protein ATI53_10753 [Salipiger aestuarii]